MLWWLENRRTFFIGFIVLVELAGIKNCLPSLRVTAEKLVPFRGITDFKIGTLHDERTDSFRVKRGQISTLEVNKVRTNDSSSNVTRKIADNHTTSPTPNTLSKIVKGKTLIIPDRSPANFTLSQIKEESSIEEGDVSTTRSGQGDFDEKAVQRAIVVIAGIAVIVMVYLGIKFALLKKRKVVKRYGRVEASEMDLLDEKENDSDEEEELFDINQQRR